MTIHVVQKGDTIHSIAASYGIKVDRLIQDNGLINPNNLVEGQAIAIAFPEQIHIVREGDTLGSIVENYGITLMQLLRNNSFLFDRRQIYVGEELVIKYPTMKQIETSGFTYAFINNDVLIRTLPYLTYLSVFNYRAGRAGEVTQYQDDTDVIRFAKEYGVIPLLTIATVSRFGEPDPEAAYEIFLNDEFFNRHMDNILFYVRTKGYAGVNMIFSYINSTNQYLYRSYVERASRRIREEGYLYYITINPISENTEDFRKIDFAGIDQYVDGITLMKFVWGTLMDPPGPVSPNTLITNYMNHLLNYVSPGLLFTGLTVLGYEWSLPYQGGRTVANSLTYDSVINLAVEADATIYYNDVYQRPYFDYSRIVFAYNAQQVVWFVDGRSIDSVLEIADDYNVQGIAIWNIMAYFAQQWLTINSQYEIVKLIPDEIG